MMMRNQKRNYKKFHKLTMNSTVRTLSVKCYEEQLTDGWKETAKRIKECQQNIQVIAIKHDKDYAHDDIWLPGKEKPHYHIIMKLTDNKTSHVSGLLTMLGVCFRKGLDEVLWDNHGVETVGNFRSMAKYLTHDTEQAIRDGKVQYSLEELVSNLPPEEIKRIREGRSKNEGSTDRVKLEELAALDQQAMQLGYELKDFDQWYEELPFRIRSHPKMKTIERTYHSGVRKRVQEQGEVNRLCIFIKGVKNVGKTYSAIHSLENKNVLTVGGGGSGKFDRLSPSTEAIVIDDDRAPNLLNMTDNYMCQAYKRMSDNPYWCGKYFIVTSNLSFREWLEECGIKTVACQKPLEYTEQYRAMESRFYVCHIDKRDGKNRLICDSVSKRGTKEEQIERKNMFVEFRDKYNLLLASYSPELIDVDYDDVIGDGGEPITGCEEKNEEFSGWEQIDMDKLGIFEAVIEETA